MKYTEQDVEVLKRQLDREPRNLVGVAKRCQGGYPQVVVTSPILEGNKVGIFPTTLWLTCPELNYRIGKLESKGLVQEIGDKIMSDDKLSKRLEEAHQGYAEYRLNLVDPQRLKVLQENNPGQYRVLKESGVGGILDFEGIKCLHTHYGHYLIDDNNPVGEIVDQLLTDEFGKVDCTDCSKRCEEEE